MLFYPANTVHHYLMHGVNVPTCYSVVPGNARWNLAAIEFSRTCEQASFYHQKESTQRKRRDRKKEHLVNKRYVTFLCSSPTSSPLHFWKLMGVRLCFTLNLDQGGNRSNLRIHPRVCSCVEDLTKQHLRLSNARIKTRPAALMYPQFNKKASICGYCGAAVGALLHCP